MESDPGLLLGSKDGKEEESEGVEEISAPSPRDALIATGRKKRRVVIDDSDEEEEYLSLRHMYRELKIPQQQQHESAE